MRFLKPALPVSSVLEIYNAYIDEYALIRLKGTLSKRRPFL